MDPAVPRSAVEVAYEGLPPNATLSGVLAGEWDGELFAGEEEKENAAEPGNGECEEEAEEENEVQNDNWPVDCIKCNISLDTLENFNQHMRPKLRSNPTW